MNTKRLFNSEKIDFKFDYPKDITEEKFFEFLELAYKKFWYEVYNMTVEKYQGVDADNNEFGKFLGKANLPQVKRDAWIKVGN